MNHSRPVLLLSLLTTLGCADAAPESAPQRGAVVRVDAIGSLDAEAVRHHLAQFDLDASRVRSGVEAHRILYATVDAEGNATTASALVAIPSARESALSVAVWMHGTTVFRGEAASVNDESSDRAAAKK